MNGIFHEPLIFLKFFSSLRNVIYTHPPKHPQFFSVESSMPKKQNENGILVNFLTLIYMAVGLYDTKRVKQFVFLVQSSVFILVHMILNL